MPDELTEDEVRRFVRLDIDPDSITWQRGSLDFTYSSYFHRTVVVTFHCVATVCPVCSSGACQRDSHCHNYPPYQSII